MSVYNKNNKFISYLAILIALFILVLVTKEQVVLIQENIDLKETNSVQLAQKKAKLSELNTLKNELVSSSEDISKYSIEIKEDELINYIYSYIEKTNDNEGIALVKSISISDPEDTEMWFKETIINLNLRMPNEKRLKDFLDFLTSTNSKYKFYISSFSFPYGNIEWNFNVSIPLKVLNK